MISRVGQLEQGSLETNDDDGDGYPGVKVLEEQKEEADELVRLGVGLAEYSASLKEVHGTSCCSSEGQV